MLLSGLLKWITECPSSINKLTSSISGNGWQANFLNPALSFLSSLPLDYLWEYCFLLDDPFPPNIVLSPNLALSFLKIVQI